MTIYQITNTPVEGAVAVNRQFSLLQSEASAAQQAAACAAAANWKLEYYAHFVCVARSDNGIDDNRITTQKVIEITPDMIVLQGDDAVGVYHKGGLFLFADTATHHREVVLNDGYVGGWGDVTETAYYILKSVEAV